MNRRRDTSAEMRASIIAVLDKHDAWQHVAMQYISGIIYKGYARPVKDRSRLSQRYSIGRIVADLNDAIGNVMDVPAIIRNAEKGQ